MSAPPMGSIPMGPIPLLTPPPIPGIAQLKKDLTASVDYLVAFTAIMIWDVVSTFPSEFRFVWKANWSHLKVVFFLNRYGSLLLQILNMSLVVAKVSPAFCHDFFWFTPLVGTYVMTICGTIFSLHVWALYNRDCRIGGILASGLLSLVATMASNGSQFTHVVFTPATQQYLNFYGCIIAGKPGQTVAPTIIFWSAPFLFSLLIIVLALHHSARTRDFGGGGPEHLSIVRALLRDGIWYLSVPVVVNLVSVILASQTANPNLHNFNAAGSISLNFVMANRLMLSNFRHNALTTSSMTPGSRETPRCFNPNLPPNSFALGATPAMPATAALPPPLDHVEDIVGDEEKYDHNLDLEAGTNGSLGGVEMERKCSGTTTLADDRSIRTKHSDATFQITGSSGQSGDDSEPENAANHEKVNQTESLS